MKELGLHAAPLPEPGSAPAPLTIATVSGVPLHRADELLSEDELRQRACTELLRQAAQRAGLLAVGDVPSADGVISEEASAAIERLLEREVSVPEPDEEAKRRHYAARLADYTRGERVLARHVLFAVTEGVDVQALRRRAEQTLLELRCADSASPAFAEAAATLSNCPSSREGGSLDWLTREDCAPEFAAALFGGQEIGVLSRLVATRFGLHVVEVKARQAGTALPFEQVEGAVTHALRQQTWTTALRQYLRLLAAEAQIEGVLMPTAESPLLQ